MKAAFGLQKKDRCLSEEGPLRAAIFQFVYARSRRVEIPNPPPQQVETRA